MGEFPLNIQYLKTDIWPSTHTPPSPFLWNTLPSIPEFYTHYSSIYLNFKASPALAMHQLHLYRNGRCAFCPDPPCCPLCAVTALGPWAEVQLWHKGAHPSLGQLLERVTGATLLVVPVSCLLAQPIMPSIICYMNVPTDSTDNQHMWTFELFSLKKEPKPRKQLSIIPSGERQLKTMLWAWLWTSRNLF